MLNRTKTLLLVVLALSLTVAYWGCDRLTGDMSANQSPIVEFVNVPLDSTTFNFAPRVYWTGYDPDGFITAYQYHDDSTQAAVDSYRTSDQALLDYIRSLPPEAWITTQKTSETVYLLRGVQDTTEHVFMVRCVDNLNAVSDVRVRVFFRTNQAPDPPTIKWALDFSLDTLAIGYVRDYPLPDTLFLGDTITSTFPGITFLWKGTDPDSRALNIIPLEFSWLMVNQTNGLEVPHPIHDDSNRVVGWGSGWSSWSSSAQATFFALFGPEALQTGRYFLRVRVRDDGLTEADSEATASFYATRPTFEKQLLVVDENYPSPGYLPPWGMAPDTMIMNFYHRVIPEAVEVAEAIRQSFYSDTLTEPFVYDGQVDYFENKNVDLGRYVPYNLIGHYKWVWVICDNPVQGKTASEVRGIALRQKVMADYMNVGGQVMLSGRRVMRQYAISKCGTLDGEVPTERFFSRYFNLEAVCASQAFNPNEIESRGQADFAGASTNDPFLPDLEIDTAKVRRLRYRRPVNYLPEIDYFGRVTTFSGFSLSSTNFNYESYTATESSFDTTNVLCAVDYSTPTVCYLNPVSKHRRILRATRIWNPRLQVSGEFMYVDVNSAGDWRIVCSTPAERGQWVNTDSVRADYVFIPTSTSHDQPVAIYFDMADGIYEVDRFTYEVTFSRETRFRSAFYSFPFSFIDTAPVFVPILGDSLNPVAVVLASQMIQFNWPRRMSGRYGD